MSVVFSIMANALPSAEFLICINSTAVLLGYLVVMQSIADKLADVVSRIIESEQRIAEQQERIAHGNCGEAALAALMLYSAAGTLSEMRIYKARLEHLIAVKASAAGCEHMRAGAADGLA